IVVAGDCESMTNTPKARFGYKYGDQTLVDAEECTVEHSISREEQVCLIIKVRYTSNYSIK
ncbi:3601_t:CDS:2, partial [Scutellospora calospora]